MRNNSSKFFQFFVAFCFCILIYSINRLLYEESDQFMRDGLTFILFGFCSLIFLSKTPKKFRYILLTAVTLRLFAATISFYEIFPLEGSLEDGVYFERVALEMSLEGFRGISTGFFLYLSNFYSLFISIIYTIFGQNIAFIVVINVFLGTFTVWRVGQLSEILYGKSYRSFAMWLATFTLYLIIFSATPIRESLHLFCITSAIFYRIKFEKLRNNNSIILSILFAVLSAILHASLIIFLVVIYLSILFSVWHRLIKNRSKSAIFGALILLTLGISIPFITQGFLEGDIRIYKLDTYASNDKEDFDSYLFRNAGTSVESSGTYRSNLAITSFSSFLILLPEALIPFFYKPYPWEILKIRFPFLYIHTFMWVFFTYISIKNFKNIINNRFFLLVLLLSCSILIPYAFGSFQMNQAIRHNTKALPVILAFLVPYIKRYF